jgi:hypothetical protein
MKNPWMEENSVIENNNVPADNTPVPVTFDPVDLAVLGSQMSAAGLSQLEVAGIIDMAQKLATKVALSMVPALLELVTSTHKASAKEVERLIRARHSVMGISRHTQCIEIARQVAAATPKHGG